MSEEFFRHKHLFTYLKLWDTNGDGILSWEDFKIMAEYYTKIQRRGQLDKDVLDRWLSIFEKWWNELKQGADYNADTFVEYEEWVKFFSDIGKKTTKFEELPEFLRNYIHLLFLSIDVNKDALFCVKDYKKYLAAHKLDATKAEENFKSMLVEEDKEVGNALTSDRFKQLMYEHMVSTDPASKSKYICGPFDSISMEELKKMIKPIK